MPCLRLSDKPSYNCPIIINSATVEPRFDSLVQNRPTTYNEILKGVVSPCAGVQGYHSTQRDQKVLIIQGVNKGSVLHLKKIRKKNKKKWFEGLLYCNLQCFFWCYNVLWMTISKRTFVETSTSGDHAMQEIFGPNSRPQKAQAHTAIPNREVQGFTGKSL